MTKNPMAEIDHENPLASRGCLIRPVRLANLAVICCAVVMAVTGCQTPGPPKGMDNPATAHSEAINLREGDVLKISFPGAPNLNTSQQIRRDGQITLPLVGEVKAAGMTPAELEKKLVERYDKELVSKEVTVAVESSSFPVFVTGAVTRPGKVSSNHALTALEAIMEAGGFDYTKANLKKVKVIRDESGHVVNYIVNLKDVMDGKSSKPFYLKPNDIIFVPERFIWF